MKKNEQLFDIMGDIPEEYVEDALNDNAVTEKKISVKRVAGTIAACAAAFAAVAAVPILMMYVNGKSGNGNDQLPVTSDTVAVLKMDLSIIQRIRMKQMKISKTVSCHSVQVRKGRKIILLTGSIQVVF